MCDLGNGIPGILYREFSFVENRTFEWLITCSSAVAIEGRWRASVRNGTGKPMPKTGRRRADGERKTVTALLAEIKGSTDLDPEKARAIVDPAL